MGEIFSKGADGFFLIKVLFVEVWAFHRHNYLYLGKKKIILINVGRMCGQSLTLMKIIEVQGRKSKVQLRWMLVPTCSQETPTAPLLPVRNRPGLG